MITIPQSNQQTMRKLFIVSLAMFGFGFALIPFYQKICEVTGINLLLKPAEITNTQIDTARSVTIEFDSNLRSSLPWTFKPLETSVSVHPGALTTVMYEIRNTSTRAITAQAVPSYGPHVAEQYFKKIDCFCFTKQTLQPGESRQMPVAFVIESGLPKEIGTITLSYSFFEVEGAGKKAG